MFKTLRTLVDILMFLTLPVMMGGYHFIPIRHFHNHLGMVVFVLWVVHFVLNRRWYAALFKGHYNAMRILQTVVNLGVVVMVLAMMFSGIVLAVNAGPISLARDTHLIASHWYIVFASLHMGMHLDRLYKKSSHSTRGLVLQIAVGLFGAYGVSAFITHELYLYLFAQAMFFNNHAENGVILFLVDALAIIALFANVGYYALGALRRK